MAKVLIARVLPKKIEMPKFEMTKVLMTKVLMTKDLGIVIIKMGLRVVLTARCRGRVWRT